MIALRARQQRNMLTTLFFSLGVPMLSGGDEIGRTQLGNNNAWCQDNEIAWYDWELDESREHLLAFAKRLIATAQGARDLPRLAVLRRRHRRGGAARRLVVPPGRPEADPQATGSATTCVPSGCS